VSGPVLVGLEVAGDPDSWRAAGFSVDDDGVCRLGHVRMQTGVGQAGISGWTLGDAPVVEAGVHPNGTTVLDHLVVFTDDPERTVRAYADLGLEVRRVRDLGNGRTQTFFRAGEVIIELVGPIDGDGERFFGLSPTVSDLDACAQLLGDRLGKIKDATQPGRQIATLRHEACGLTIPIAFMSREATAP
jgi:Glyoxalase/Bleomycin resistance protein/Dioxygenase superfamily